MIAQTVPPETRRRTPAAAPRGGVAAAVKAVTRSTLRPFTVEHFRSWASKAKLDTSEGFVLEPYQEAFLEDVFAGIAECWLIVPEGNGKTTFVALLALYHAEFRPFAGVPIAASSREQAEIMYRQAEGFVLRSPAFHRLLHSKIQAAKGKLKVDVPRFVCLEGYRRINHHGGSRIQVMAAEDRTGDGIIPTFAITDELHRHKDLALYRTWAGKLEKRGGQLVAISTAGEPGSDFEQTRERIRQTATSVNRAGCHTVYRGAGVVMHEWAVPEKGDVTDMALVKGANPFSGITVESLAAKFSKPTMTMSHWRRLTCNLATRGANSAITEDEWRRAEATKPIPVGERIWLGLDVAWKWDTTAAVPLWWRDADYRQLGTAEIVVPPRDGSLLSPDVIKAALKRIHDRNPIDTVVMDMSFAADLADWIETELGARVIDRTQSPAMAAQDYERFMEGLGAGKLKHSGDVGLTEHAMHAIAKSAGSGDDTRFYRPVEGRQSGEQERRVIDALVAGSMVHSVAVGVHALPVEPEVKPWVIVR